MPADPGRELRPATPVIQSIFSPLAQAKNLVGGDQLIVHIRKYPDAVHAGLRTIVDTTLRFLEAAIQTGIAGIFYAVQQAQYGLLTEAEFDEFGRRYDLQVLEPAKDLWLNMLHLHGDEVMFAAVADYPVQIINWHDQETPPAWWKVSSSSRARSAAGSNARKPWCLARRMKSQQRRRRRSPPPAANASCSAPAAWRPSSRPTAT